MLTLRPYQQNAVDAVYQHLREHDTNPVVVIPTGGGKTPVMATICRDAVQQWNGRVLVLAHVKELLQQSVDKLRQVCPDLPVGIYSAGLKRRDTEHAVIVAGIQSVYKRACELDAFDLVLVDECFPAGTQIATPNGSVAIELVRAGDTVLNALGVGEVLATSARPAIDMVTVEFVDGTSLTCTERHPIFTNQGWQTAGTLEPGAMAFGIEDVRVLREGVFPVVQGVAGRERSSHEGTPLEPPEVLLNLLLQEAQQPDVRRCHAAESQRESTESRSSTTGPGWERTPIECSATGTSHGARPDMDVGVCCTNSDAQDFGLADSLQDRCGESRAPLGDRNRWQLPRTDREENSGSSQDIVLGGMRVVRVAHHQCESPRTVYNLHVAGHPSYFAHGVLVHNCHLIPADGEGMYRQFLADARIINPHVRVVGFTATPFRLDAGPICREDHFLNAVCYEVGVRQLIADGFLSPLISKAGLVKADTSQLHVRAGEFVASEVEQAMDDTELVESACSELVEATRDRNAVLIFASGVKHGRHVCQVLAEKHGIECGFVCGETPDAERDELLARFRGEPDGLFPRAPLKFLCNVNVLTTGFDAPNVDCVVLFRPTLSPGLYYQMVGRGFRLFPGKLNCLVLDYGGNVLRHGPVDQLLLKDKARLGEGEAPAKECPQCRALIAPAYSHCPQCGFEFPPPERKKHDAQASRAGVLAGQATDTEFEVRDITYSVHTKKDADESAPKTLRVDYRLGLDYWVSEWICLEHTGWARRKAEQWWKARSPDPVPDSAQRAADLAEAWALAHTEFVTVRSVAGEKFERILHCKLGPKPEPCAVYATVNLDDVPF